MPPTNIAAIRKVNGSAYLKPLGAVDEDEDAEMSEALDQVSMMLGKLEEGQKALHDKIDTTTNNVTARINEMATSLDNLSKRHNALDVSHTKTVARIGVIGAAIATGVTFLIDKIRFNFGN